MLLKLNTIEFKVHELSVAVGSPGCEIVACSLSLSFTHTHTHTLTHSHSHTYRVVKEEIADDAAPLPNTNGRVVCWVRLSLRTPLSHAVAVSTCILHTYTCTHTLYTPAHLLCAHSRTHTHTHTHTQQYR